MSLPPFLAASLRIAALAIQRPFPTGETWKWGRLSSIFGRKRGAPRSAIGGEARGPGADLGEVGIGHRPTDVHARPVISRRGRAGERGLFLAFPPTFHPLPSRPRRATRKKRARRRLSSSAASSSSSRRGPCGPAQPARRYKRTSSARVRPTSAHSIVAGRTDMAPSPSKSAAAVISSSGDRPARRRRPRRRRSRSTPPRSPPP